MWKDPSIGCNRLMTWGHLFILGLSFFICKINKLNSMISKISLISREVCKIVLSGFPNLAGFSISKRILANALRGVLELGEMLKTNIFYKWETA